MNKGKEISRQVTGILGHCSYLPGQKYTQYLERYLKLFEIFQDL